MSTLASWYERSLQQEERERQLQAAAILQQQQARNGIVNTHNNIPMFGDGSAAITSNTEWVISDDIRSGDRVLKMRVRDDGPEIKPQPNKYKQGLDYLRAEVNDWLSDTKRQLTI